MIKQIRTWVKQSKRNKNLNLSPNKNNQIKNKTSNNSQMIKRILKRNRKLKNKRTILKSGLNRPSL